MVDEAREGRGDDGGVLTLVCLKCGQEYYYDDGTPPPGMTCEK